MSTLAAADPVGELIFGGPLLLALPIAVLAGLVAFASPCVLPLVPAYLGYVGGVTEIPTPGPAQQGANRLALRATRARVLLGVALFITGFASVFVLFSVAFASLGASLRTWLPLATQIAGGVVIVMGLVFIGQVSFLQRQFSLPVRAATGVAGAPLLGVIFGFGWAPCVGPTLVAVNSLAFSVGDVPRAVILAIAYSLGLGIPFVLLAIGFQFATRAVGFLRTHIRAINIAGGVFLMLIGAAMVVGLWYQWMSWLQVVIGGTVTPL